MIEPPDAAPIQRHKTAILRRGFSAPVNCLLRDGLLDSSSTFFDYGCGRGKDLALLQDKGIPSDGWDPVHQPQARRSPADVVNLGFVINVIEDPAERAEALKQAWRLCNILLVVAAQTNLVAHAREHSAFSDGVLTSRQTFQKYYTQAELRVYLEEQLGTTAVPAAPGVFYLFRDEAVRQQYLANRYRRQASIPRKRISEVLFEQNLDVLEPFMQVVARLGRLPGEEEFAQAPAVVERLGSLKRAFALVAHVTDIEPWKAIAQRRKEDLLVYLALARFHKRPVVSKLPSAIQRDVKGFFSTYTRACEQADTLLFSVSDAAAIDEACQKASVGQLVDNALFVHRPMLNELNPLLRIYEGCARALVGEIDEANVIKLHRHSGKVSYLCYRNFDADPNPELQVRIKVSLRTLDIDFFDYSRWNAPPFLENKGSILHSAIRQGAQE